MSILTLSFVMRATDWRTLQLKPPWSVYCAVSQYIKCPSLNNNIKKVENLRYTHLHHTQQWWANITMQLNILIIRLNCVALKWSSSYSSSWVKWCAKWAYGSIINCDCILENRLKSHIYCCTYVKDFIVEI